MFHSLWPKLSIAALLVIFVTGGFYYVYTASKKPQKEIRLSDLCSCHLLVDSSKGLVLLNPETGKQDVIEPGTDEDGKPSSGPARLSLSPSGTLELQRSQDQTKVQIIRLPEKTVLKEFPLEHNFVVQNSNWSPDGNVIVIVTQQQVVHGTEPMPIDAFSQGPQYIETFNIDTGTHVSYQAPTVVGQLDRPQVIENASIDNDGQHVLFTWDEEAKTRVFLLNLPKDVHELIIPSFKRDSANINYPGVMFKAFIGQKLFLATKKELGIFSLAGKSISITPLDTWSGSSYSPVSPDGRSLVIARHKTGRAYGELILHNIQTGSTRILNPKFEQGTGLEQAAWLPGGRYLLTHDTYGQRWYVVDTSKKVTSFSTVTIKGLENTDIINAIVSS